MRCAPCQSKRAILPTLRRMARGPSKRRSSLAAPAGRPVPQRPFKDSPTFAFFFPSATPKDRLKRTGPKIRPGRLSNPGKRRAWPPKQKSQARMGPPGNDFVFFFGGGEGKKLSGSVDIQKRHKITTLNSAPTALLRRLASSQSRRIKCRFESFSSDEIWWRRRADCRRRQRFFAAFLFFGGRGSARIARQCASPQLEPTPISTAKGTFSLAAPSMISGTFCLMIGSSSSGASKISSS